MQHLREHEPRPEPRPAGERPPMEAACDLAALAGAATGAAAIATPPATVTVTVKTTGSSATRIVATPDTTVAEVMGQACRDLGIRDPERWALVAGGEVTGDTWALRDLVHEGELTMRLVKRPEAGA